MSARTARRAARLAVLALLLGLGGPLAAESSKLKQTLKFAAQMAKKGNWREARFRWEQAAALDPDNVRILNNLAVASEVLDEIEVAESFYESALSRSDRDPRIDENWRRFHRFQQLERAAAEGEDGNPADPYDDPPIPPGKKSKKDAMEVVARFELPPRLDPSGFDSLLVASFVTGATDLLETNREITRFLRREFHKRSRLDVLDVTPAPAIPEQTVEDLLANHEFWKHLGREYGADLIVSGVVDFLREDRSGFQDVDVVSPVTGQKVRETRFVEQVQFTYTMDLFFIEGATGTLVFRDRLHRSATYPEGANDPLTAFHELVGTIVREVLAVISPRVREDVRFIFES